MTDSTNNRALAFTLQLRHCGQSSDSTSTCYQPSSNTLPVYRDLRVLTFLCSPCWSEAYSLLATLSVTVYQLGRRHKMPFWADPPRERVESYGASGYPGHYNSPAVRRDVMVLDLPCSAEVGDFSESLARGFCNDLPSYIRWWPKGYSWWRQLPMFYTPAHYVSCTFPVYRALSPMAFISLYR